MKMLANFKKITFKFLSIFLILSLTVCVLIYLKNEVEELEEEISFLSDRIEELDNENISINESKENLSQENIYIGSQIDSIDQEISYLEYNQSSLKEDIDSFKTKLEEKLYFLEERIERLEKKAKIIL